MAFQMPDSFKVFIVVSGLIPRSQGRILSVGSHVDGGRAFESSIVSATIYVYEEEIRGTVRLLRMQQAPLPNLGDVAYHPRPWMSGAEAIHKPFRDRL